MLTGPATLVLGFCVGQALVSASPCSTLPVVDLGYVRQQATSYNATTDIYTFSNIRYAQDTSGEGRFLAPREPLSNRSTIQTGAGVKMCPQAYPDWLVAGETSIGEFASGEPPFTLDAWEKSFNETIPPIDFNTDTSEDCLFLDVYVPGKVMNNAARSKAPVLVYIHGGGFVIGSKLGTSGESLPTGLLQQSMMENGEGMIYVALNYRLGAFGFLAGPEVEKNGVVNAGLLDQRMALDWVQKYIELFGGSACQVTAIGESGGASSILLHMAAYGGKFGSTPFSQAIVQSPAVSPNLVEASSTYADFLSLLNATTLDEVRKLDSTSLITANAQQLVHAPLNNFIYNVVTDDGLVPGPLRSDTSFDRSVKIMAAHNSFEGGIFFDPSVKNETQFSHWVQNSIIGLASSQLEYLTKTLYPPVFDGSQGYVDYDSRMMSLWGEGWIDCNFLLANQVFDHTYAYEFSVSPGAHTQDLGYTFNDPTSPVASVEAQNTLQRAVAAFTMNGVPTYNVNGKQRAFPTFGSDGALVNISIAAPTVSKSTINETRCHWWKTQKY